MSSYVEVALSFKEATKIKGKKPNSLNIYTIQRMIDSGKEIKTFEVRTKKGISTENPLDNLLRKGTLNKKQHRAGKDYCHAYEMANISHHARPSYDGTTVSSIDYKQKDFLTQNQFEASKKIAECRNKIAVKNFTKRGKKIVNLRYFQIIESVFEKQQMIRVVERNTGMNHCVVERKVKEICDILSD